MTYRKTMLSVSIAAALAFTGAAYAQSGSQDQASQATTQTSQDSNSQKHQEENPQKLEGVVVVGIRAAKAKSLDVKRNASAHIDVVTAQDIGKLPAKNVADTIAQLPGVNISTASLDEGGFDEADRVSLRGTSPSLTQTLIDGHAVASADWFVLNQGSTMGRSVSYSLLPSEIVSQVKVFKTSEARIQDGGSAGSINILTRRPLSFDKKLTFHATAGGVYADNPDTTDPQFSALFNYKGDNFGFLLQGFYEVRHLSRQAQELPSGFAAIPDDAPVVATNPDLAGVYVPSLLGSTLFTQKRERKGGLARFEWQLNDALTLNLTGFYSKMGANNYNRNYMLWGSNFAFEQAPDPGYTVENGVLTDATYTGQPDMAYTVYDMIARDAYAQSDFYTADLDWNISDNLTSKFQVGTTGAKGVTQRQYIAEVTNDVGGGAEWHSHGTDSPVDWSAGGPNTPESALANGAPGTWGNQLVRAVDSENWLSADFTQYFDSGVLTSLDYGLRFSDHHRRAESPEGATPLAGWASGLGGNAGHYPSDFASDLSGNFPRDVWYFDRDALKEAIISGSNWLANDDGPNGRHNYGAEFNVKEKNTAAYLQANFEGDRWSGNVGLRYVDIKQLIYSYQVVESGPGEFNSLFGAWNRLTTRHHFKRLLPSANFKFNLSDNLVLRAAASQTQTLPDYSALGAAPWGSDLDKTGGGGNPNLKPIKSTNFDGTIGWYFMPRGLLSLNLYSMDLKNYISFGNHETKLFSELTNQLETYTVSTPVNSHAHVQGYSLQYNQPIGDHFGFDGSYTFADGRADPGAILNQDGTPSTDMIGTSKNTYSASAYFENQQFNARVNYRYRSSFLIGLSGAVPDYQEGFGALSLSLGYSPTDWLSFNLDAMNLNNPVYKYNQSGSIPRAFYANGRQYYLTASFKF